MSRRLWRDLVVIGMDRWMNHHNSCHMAACNISHRFQPELNVVLRIHLLLYAHMQVYCCVPRVPKPWYKRRRNSLLDVCRRTTFEDTEYKRKARTRVADVLL